MSTPQKEEEQGGGVRKEEKVLHAAVSPTMGLTYR
jgi:hypothetical protein